MRSISISSTRKDEMKAAKKKRIDVVAYIPLNRYSDTVHKSMAAAQGRMNKLKPKERLKALKNNPYVKSVNWGTTKLKPYKITCTQCKQKMGVVWAKNKALENWQDFYYTQWHDENEWFGCFTPQVSPISGMLCIECTCGQDSRDFRANRSLPPQVVKEIEEVNSKGREWGDKSSYFEAKPISITQLTEVLHGRSYLH